MSGKWPTGWRQALLRHINVEISQHALDVLADWNKSTPIEPWTHNPLGLDAKEANRPPVAHTRYAWFESPQQFRDEMKKLANTSAGHDLISALIDGSSHSEAWRAIQGLNTPGRHTETDYPSALLDRIESAYTDQARRRAATGRRTTGIVRPLSAPHEAVRAQGALLHHAASNLMDAKSAIHMIMRRLG